MPLGSEKGWIDKKSMINIGINTNESISAFFISSL